MAMLNICVYGENHFQYLEDTRLTDFVWPEAAGVWLDYTSRPAEPEIAELAGRLSIHPIALRNLFDEALRPRLQEFGSTVFLGARAVVQDGDAGELLLAPISFFLGTGFLLTAHPQAVPIVERARSRLESNAGSAQAMGTDYLLYLLLDCLVDDYYSEVDQMAEAIDEIDSRAGETYDKHLQADVLRSKRRLLVLHKAITPLRDILLNLRRTDQKIVSPHTEVYLRDIFEHILQLLDTIDTYREVLSNTTELAMAAASNRMNEVMTVLTVITSFFIPLNFIVGYFGMNLIMPEANRSVTYPIVIVIMVTTVLSMFYWFKRKKWL
jgi:magnesium transporter